MVPLKSHLPPHLAIYSCPDCEQKANLVKNKPLFFNQWPGILVSKTGMRSQEKGVSWATSFSSSGDLHYLSFYGLSTFWDSCSLPWTDAELEHFIRDLAASSLLQWRNSELKCSPTSLSGLMSDVSQFLLVIARECTVSNSRQMSGFKSQASNLCIFAPY